MQSNDKQPSLGQEFNDVSASADSGRGHAHTRSEGTAARRVILFRFRISIRCAFRRLTSSQCNMSAPVLALFASAPLPTPASPSFHRFLLDLLPWSRVTNQRDSCVLCSSVPHMLYFIAFDLAIERSSF